MKRRAGLAYLLGLALACGCASPESESFRLVTSEGVAVSGGSGPTRPVPLLILEFAGHPEGGGSTVIRVSGVDPIDLRKLREGRGDAPGITVRVVRFEHSGSPGGKSLMEVSDVEVSGAVEVIGEAAYFVPQFPFEPGIKYLAQFSPSGGGEPVSNILGLEKAARASAAEVVAVYPSAEVLPENLLKFYLHFSEPMRQGGVYEFIELVDQEGRKADVPFLEVAEELWDASGSRLTLFIDPGRVKREVKPLEDLGPAMAAGGLYTLRVDRRWPDASGKPLKQGFEKRFRVSEPDRGQPDIKTWKLSEPRANTTEALHVELGEPLDRALLERLIWVKDLDGVRVEGRVSISNEETRWSFEPARSWKSGEFRLVADEWLEDLAGNRIGRPFEVDIFEKVSERIETKTVSVGFLVR